MGDTLTNLSAAITIGEKPLGTDKVHLRTFMIYYSLAYSFVKKIIGRGCFITSGGERREILIGQKDNA